MSEPAFQGKLEEQNAKQLLELMQQTERIHTLEAEVERLTAKLAQVVEAATLKRNVLIHDSEDFMGEWVAVPREDFDALHVALAAVKEKP